MKIDVRTQGIKMTPDLESFIHSEAAETMKSYNHRISKLKVRLKEVHQPNGMTDIQCCVEVRVKRLQTVVVIKRCDDPYSVVHQTISQAAWSTVRLLENQQIERYQRNIGRLNLGRQRNLIPAT